MPEERVVETTRPPTVVTPLLKINGTTVPEKYKAEAIAISNEVNKIPLARVVLSDGDAADETFEASNDALFIPGSEVEILSGYQADYHSLFKGIVIKHSIKIRSNGGSVLVLDCKDIAVRMTVGVKNKYFTGDIKDSEAIEQITATYSGLSAEVEPTGVTHKELVQFACTDWDFLVSRADVNGKICLLDGGKLTVKKPDMSQSPVLNLVYGASILELDAEVDARHQHKAVVAKSWSSDDQSVVEKTVTDPGITTNGNFTGEQLAGVAGPDEFLLKHSGEVAEQELAAWGEACWQKAQLAKVRGRVRFRGTHTVKPGTTLELGGVGNRFSGNCFISGVHHNISAGDWQTDAQLGLNPQWFAQQYPVTARPAAGLLPAVNGLQIGLVTALERDPEARNRIKVYLPIINTNEQGTWARVATLDAGNDRGSFFLPEVGDEVIVGFLNDDPRDPVVLGMVNSSARPAPLQAADENDIKGFVTRSKLKLLFDDKKKAFSLETPAGKKFLIDEEAGEIKLEDENGNKITMDSNGIKIESNGKIEIKAAQDVKLEGLNVEVKATVAFKAEGSASLEATSGGTTTVRGSLVQIN